MLVDPPALRAGFLLPAGEGALTAFAAITALFVAMDHEVALSRTTVGAAAPVVTELLVRVHADTHPFFEGQRPKKDVAGPAYSSTQPSSTLPWGATPRALDRQNPEIGRKRRVGTVVSPNALTKEHPEHREQADGDSYGGDRGPQDVTFPA